MNAGTQGNPLNINLTHSHSVTKIDDVIGYPTKVWRAARKYSVNNTLPIAAVNILLQFSLAYVAAIIITHNDLSFIPTIVNSTLMSAYVLVFVILGAVLLTSLALRYMNKQEIKEENLVDSKIRGGKSGEISEIAKDALKIEIIPNLSDIGYKKQNFSIVLPISEEQNKILENQKEENRNKTFLLITIPCAISAAIIVGALVQNRFSFTNIQGWLEICFISLVFIVAAVSICITLSKLKNNEINHKDNYIKKFDNLDILLSWKKGNIVSVMEKKEEDLEEKDPLSRLIKLLDTHLTNFTDEIVSSFDKHLDEAKDSLGKKLLEPANANIKGTLDNMGKNIKTLLDNLEVDIKQNVCEVKTYANKEIAQCLREVSNSINVSLKELRAELAAKLNQIQPRGVGNWLFTLSPTASNGQSCDTQGTHSANNHDSSSGGANSDNNYNSPPESSEEDVFSECQTLNKKDRDEINDIIQTKLGPIQEQFMTLQNLIKENRSDSSRDSGIDSESSSNDSRNVQQDKEKVLDQELAGLEKANRMKEKQEKIDKLKKKSSGQATTDEWKEKLNGKASEFLHYILESTKLKIKDDQGKEVKIKNDEGQEVYSTLRNFDNKIIIHWKDGSQTTCYMSKQGDLQVQPSTTVDFVDKNIHAAFAVACAV